MGRSFRGGDRNHTTILFNADQNNYVMPTTIQLINQADYELLMICFWNCYQLTYQVSSCHASCQWMHVMESN